MLYHVGDFENMIMSTNCIFSFQEIASHWQTFYKTTQSLFQSQLFCGRLTMKTFFILSSFIFIAVSAVDIAKKPKLFFVSTSATTSTLSTNSVCYISSNAAVVSCAGRKRRSLNFDQAEMSSLSQTTSASKSSPSGNVAGERDGRFLLYWITTTSISTSTSYTTTLTISSVQCTPTGVTKWVIYITCILSFEVCLTGITLNIWSYM